MAAPVLTYSDKKIIETMLAEQIKPVKRAATLPKVKHIKLLLAKQGPLKTGDLRQQQYLCEINCYSLF